MRPVFFLLHMSWYAVGDVQGCAGQLQGLMDQVTRVDPDPQWLFVGDLVNRGPRSLDTLRMIHALGERADCVLGNHDLHLLAVAHGGRRSGRSDTINQVLQAPDCEILLDWLRCRPLARALDEYLLVHAGLLPQWSVAQTLTLAAEVETVLRGPDWVEFLQNMYGDGPDQWHDDLKGILRWRCIVNALTRIRYCRADGSMVLKAGDAEEATAKGYLPWFDLPGRRSADTTVVFGHWSARGLILQPKLIGLDSGCIWGGKLSALRLTDRTLFQVDCPQFQRPD